MATLVTALSDGGHVEVQWTAGGEMLVQKYDASGAKVGDAYTDTPLYNQQPEVVPLAGGGFVVVTGFVLKGGVYAGYVFDASGRSLAVLDFPGSGIGLDIAASPDGGFLVASMEKYTPADGGPVDYAHHPLLTLYDNGGEVLTGPTALEGDLPAITLQADGDYLVTWTDDGQTRTLEVDSPTAASSGGGTEPAPAGQHLVSDQYGDTLQGGAGDDTLVAGQGPDQLTGGAGADVFAFHDLPWNAGHITDFASGTDRLDLSGLGAGRVEYRLDGAGNTQVYFDPDDPNAGPWPFLVTTLDGVSDAAGGEDPPPPPPPPPEAPQGQVLTSDQYGDNLAGGSGDDTLNAGQGPDVLTGAGGADRFVFGALPWNAGHITDFTPGVDKLDLSALGPGRVELRGDGSTEVYFDPDDPNAGPWPYLITVLDGVGPSQLAPSDWIV